MWRPLLFPIMASVVTALLHFAAGVPIGLSALITFLVWPILGTIITSDDDLPGGWANPDGSEIPPWEKPAFWDRLSGGCVAVTLAFAVQVQFSSQWLPLLILAGLIFAITSAYFFADPQQAKPLAAYQIQRSPDRTTLSIRIFELLYD